MTMQEKCQYLHWNVQSTHAFQEMRYLARVDFHTWPWLSVLWNAHHWPDFSWLHSGWSQHDSERLCDISDWQRGLQFQVAKQAAGHLPWKRKALHLQKSVLEKQCDSMVGISAEVNDLKQELQCAAIEFVQLAIGSQEVGWIYTVKCFWRARVQHPGIIHDLMQQSTKVISYLHLYWK